MLHEPELSVEQRSELQRDAGTQREGTFMWSL